MLKERAQSKLRLSGSHPLSKLKVTITRSSVMWRNFFGKGMPFKGLWKKLWMLWLLWQTSKMVLLMNELIVTYNIRKMSAWSCIARSEDDWLSATQSNQLPQPTSEVNSLPSPWSRSTLQCCHGGTERSVTSVSVVETTLWTKTSVWHQATQQQGWRAQD